MSKISKIKAREILDSRGNPTVEVEVISSAGIIGRAAVPSGASTGAYEAHELRDGGTRYKGKGVLNAIKNIKEKIANELEGFKLGEQLKLDQTLIQMDGTENKSNLGANAILGVSLAYAKVSALTEQKSLYKYLGGNSVCKLPVPLMNVLNGGAHANNGLDVQEFMIVPTGFTSFRESLRAGSEIFHELRSLLNKKGKSTAVGDEGGFAPKLESNKMALEFLCQAIESSGYKLGEQIHLALDVASTELYVDGKYNWEGKKLTSHELGEIYSSWKKEFPLYSVEDGFAEDDWQGWIDYTKKHNQDLQLVGDDLFVTNPKRLLDGIKKKAANSILIKVNQIGSLSETMDAVKMAHDNGFTAVMSHRSGETEDVIIADLAVALSCEQIKTGSLCRSDRVAKYNQLLRIEEELGERAQYWGDKAFPMLLNQPKV
ncbi:MAG: phosphopyruvate hydratase [Bdellovibrionaceae bacterium]|nr:phosphopyruvate hydratase [Pseudobdellovibrionaceae bacterium]